VVDLVVAALPLSTAAVADLVVVALQIAIAHVVDLAVAALPLAIAAAGVVEPPFSSWVGDELEVGHKQQQRTAAGQGSVPAEAGTGGSLMLGGGSPCNRKKTIETGHRLELVQLMCTSARQLQAALGAGALPGTELVPG
jgi:hypothetical protein